MTVLVTAIHAAMPQHRPERLSPLLQSPRMAYPTFGIFGRNGEHRRARRRGWP
jgi:hypothetical protein